MKEKQIMVVIKKPGEKPYLEPLFDNSLEAFQKAVGGYIETVTLCTDLIIICNEEGRMQNLPFNCNICGYDFYGTIVACGVKKDDFAGIKGKNISFVLDMLGRH